MVCDVMKSHTETTLKALSKLDFGQSIVIVAGKQRDMHCCFEFTSSFRAVHVFSLVLTINTVSHIPIEHELVNLDFLNLKSGTGILFASNLSAHIIFVVLEWEFSLSSRTNFCYSSFI